MANVSKIPRNASKNARNIFLYTACVSPLRRVFAQQMSWLLMDKLSQFLRKQSRTYLVSEDKKSAKYE